MQVDTFGDHVRSELDHWGREFALHRDCEYLGHQSKNMIQVLMDHKGEMPARATGYKPLEIDMRAQRIENLVLHVARTHQEMAICMRAYFCGSGRRSVERWETCTQLLQKAGLPKMSQKSYLDLVKRGEDRVRGMLEGILAVRA